MRVRSFFDGEGCIPKDIQNIIYRYVTTNNKHKMQQQLSTNTRFLKMKLDRCNAQFDQGYKIRSCPLCEQWIYATIDICTYCKTMDVFAGMLKYSN